MTGEQPMKITPSRLAAALTVALAAVLVLAAGGHAALADRHGAGRHQMHHAEHMARLAAALGLSDPQKAAARKLHEEAAARAKPLREQARLQHEEIEAMLESGSADPGDLGQRLIEMHATHEKLDALHQQTVARVRAQLNAEQRARLDRMIAQHGAGKGHGAHGPCGAPSFGD
jgi:Spy/CpxP family protein refolding chaperone